MLSAWSACSVQNTGRRGGGGIFIRPYSSVLNLQPYRESDWSQYCMAVTADLHGILHIILAATHCIKRETEKLYSQNSALLSLRHPDPFYSRLILIAPLIL